MIESEPGIRNAAPAPWAARQKISCPIDCDSPAPMEREREHDEAGQEHALAAEDVAEPAAGDEQDGELSV